MPYGAQKVVAIAGGHDHSLAVRTDGSVIAWGRNNLGQGDVPDGLRDAVAVAGGYFHSLALKADGMVVAWGLNTSGQTNVPAPSLPAVAIAAGNFHSVALRSDGTVWAWGQNSDGQTNVPAGLGNVVAIAAGYSHCLALRFDGTVTGWGNNRYGQRSVPAGLSNVVGVAAGYGHSLALRADGRVVAWGQNTWGQSTVPSGLSNVVSIAAGAFHSLALCADGRVVAWGNESSGQTAVPTGLERVAVLGSGGYHSLAIAPDVPPQASDGLATGALNGDTVVLPPCFDPNGDSLNYRIASLPVLGLLYQYTDSGPGAPILAAGTAVSDALGRVIYVPRAGETGVAYATIGFVANDGTFDSPPGWVRVNILPPPIVPSGGFGFNPDQAFVLSLAGLSNATYSVWASTNLVDWLSLGPASQSSPEHFVFIDAAATNWAWRFYEVRSP